MLLGKNRPHGGDIYKYGPVLDLSANLNPYGMPPAVERALREAVMESRAYPDPGCVELRKRIGEREGVPAEWILCGNGAAELIYHYALALPRGKPALIVGPAFREYESALCEAGIDVEYHMLTPDNSFLLTEDIFKIEPERYCAVFLCTPNNPTGRTAKRRIVYGLAKTGVPLFCDMSFLDLTETPEMYDVKRLTGEFENVTVLRSLTKSFCLAGVRLGYAISSDAGLLESMSRKTQCWNVSTFAQRAGIAALECGEWLQKTVEQVAVQRERVARELSRMGLKVFRGEANFLLFYGERQLWEPLLERGILIRDCSDFRGLGRGYLRAAIRTPEENDKLLEGIREVLK